MHNQCHGCVYHEFGGLAGVKLEQIMCGCNHPRPVDWERGRTYHELCCDMPNYECSVYKEGKQ